MIWEYLHEGGWVNFEVASRGISRFFEEVGSVVTPGSDADLAATDLIHLTAAELALPHGLRDSSSDVPFYLEVPERAAHLAVFCSDCGPFKTHNPREQPRLWDVPLLGSDASKLAWLADTDDVAVLAERFPPTVDRLAGMYQELNDRRGDQESDDPTAWRPEVFAARATLWRAKVGVLLGEEHDIGSALREVHASASGGMIA